MMPRAMRLVRSGAFMLLLGCALYPAQVLSAPATAGGQSRNSAALLDPAAREQPHAAVMDLWLATSLALLLHYYRRRRRERE